MSNPKIKILVTGGTIDDLEYEREEDAPKNHQSLIPELLQQFRISVDYELEILMQKDSKFITQEDRKLILDSCRSSDVERMIITHGTSTMSETARFLGEANLDKTIILFGAAIPANKENSDAQFNLGAAFLASQELERGVYIVMNGKVFNWDKVKKDFSTGYFKEE